MPDDHPHASLGHALIGVGGAALFGVPLAYLVVPKGSKFSFSDALPLAIMVLGGAAIIVGICLHFGWTPRGIYRYLAATLGQKVDAFVEWSPIAWRGFPSSHTQSTAEKDAPAEKATPPSREAPVTPAKVLPPGSVRITSSSEIRPSRSAQTSIEELKELAARGKRLPNPGSITLGLGDSLFQWRADVESALDGDWQALQNFRSAERGSGIAGFIASSDSASIGRQINALEKIIRDRSGGFFG
jgi:hypothetical protein